VDYVLGDTGVPLPLHSFLKNISLMSTPTLLIVAAALASLAIFALNSALEVCLTWAWSASGQRMVYDLAADLFRRLQRLSLLFHSRSTVGDSLSRLTGDTWCVFSVAKGLLISPAQNLFTLAMLSAIAWNMDSELTLLTLVVVPILGGSAIFFGGRLKEHARQNREAHSRMLSFVHQTLTAIPVVQAFSREKRNRKRFQCLSTEVVDVTQRNVLIRKGYGFVNGLITTTGTAIVLFAGGKRVLTGALSVGSLLVFLAYLHSMRGAFQGLLRTYGNLKTVEASIDRVFEVLDSDELVRDAPEARSLPPRPEGERGHVCLEGVTFGYEPDRPVLHDVTLVGRSGETVALVGPTGAGKSTLVSLILRFFDPWQGQVTIDGMDVRDVKLSSLRANVALVLQEPFLLPLTVEENIAYGRPTASLEDIVAAAVAANAHEFIRELPEGYDTVIGERGATLSGGQKQRLAIARALLKNAPVLILDEPTSALDAETESQLLEALERLMAGRTTFIIAHRLWTIRVADRIVVLDKGLIVEMGTQEKLLASQGPYYRLHSLQFTNDSREVAV
jgi:ATP-binding cassette subfamily B protein/subfamily B ATP-binding cassette protein MsbA